MKGTYDLSCDRTLGGFVNQISKLSVKPLAKLNTIVSDNGSAVKLTTVVTTGQSLSFSVKHHQIGAVIRCLQSAARTMNERLSELGEAKSAPLLMDSFTEAAEMTGVAVARDAGTGDTLLLLETAQAGSIPLRLSREALATLRDALEDHELGLS
jgi:hypothetical protein